MLEPVPPWHRNAKEFINLADNAQHVAYRQACPLTTIPLRWKALGLSQPAELSVAVPD